jgi:D-proline reductase (dithiol) PrdB
MDAHAHLTPISKRRERLDRWINDTKLGYCVARWVGSRIGVKSLQALIDPVAAIPWTPFRRPLARATVALVGTGGYHLCTDVPFRLESDASFRVIPRSAQATDICITNEHYDRRDAARDLNLIFPLERVRELEREGVVGRVAEEHYGFTLTGHPEEYAAPAREVGMRMKQAEVDRSLPDPSARSSWDCSHEE